MAMPEVSFVELVARCREGDAAAFAALTAHYEPALRVMARVQLSPALQPYLSAADLLQSVHRTLWRHLQADRLEVTGPERLLGLARTILRRKAARVWRRAQRQQRDMPGSTGSAADLGVLATLTTPGQTPAKLAELRDQVERLRQQLNPIEDQMLSLRAQGYALEEIAQQMGLSTAAVKVRMMRLRRRLQDQQSSVASSSEG